MLVIWRGAQFSMEMREKHLLISGHFSTHIRLVIVVAVSEVSARRARAHCYATSPSFHFICRSPQQRSVDNIRHSRDTGLKSATVTKARHGLGGVNPQHAKPEAAR